MMAVVVSLQIAWAETRVPGAIARIVDGLHLDARRGLARPEELLAAGRREQVVVQAARAGRRRLSSIFFGGGTPSLMAPEDVAALIARARSLFAHALDVPGGLKVQTLHAFSQGLLAAFPLEAGLPPGFRALDDRDARQLRRRALAEAEEAAP
jgi:hypothetical protein